MAKCELCLKDAELRRSHIIPEFAYKQLYDEKGRLNIIAVDSIPQAYRQSGYYQHLLCDDCEKLINRNEAYIARLFDGRTQAIVVRENGLVSYSGLDYQRFRLFFLSILWRAAISDIEFFQQVRLASNRTERLRKMLLNEDPGDTATDLWPMVFGTLIHDGELVPGLMVQPVSISIRTHHAYGFVFGGMYWHVYTSSHQQPGPVLRLNPNADGGLITVETELAEIDYLQPIVEQLPNR